MDMTQKNNTARLRQQKRNLRRALSPAQQHHNSHLLCQHISRSRTYLSSKRIACYLANDGEIDPRQLIEHAWFMNKAVYLPILAPFRQSLYFAPYKADSRMKLNRFRIPEPVCHPSEWISARQLDLLLLPLVAFDTQGNRVGMGGGFYDRTLAYLQHRSCWKKPLLAGLAHEIQKVEQLERQHWDVPLNYIITEKQLYTPL